MQHAALAKSAAFGSLGRLVRASAQDYLQTTCSLSGAEAAALVRPRRMLLWASVHAGGSAHPAHTHRDAVLSGVYYADVPEGAGDFVAGGDGGAPAHRVAPATGTLLLFPSGMPHAVAPSGCGAAAG